MLASLAIASGLFTTLFLGSRTELRLREVPLGTGGVQFAVDLETLPYARFEMRSRHFDFKIDYAADVTQPDLEGGINAGPQLFQLANMSTWYSTRDWEIGASQGGGIGQMNFSYLTPYSAVPGQSGGPPPVQLVPCTDLTKCANELVELGSSASSLTLRYKHDRSSVAVSPSYSVTGGIDDASRKIFPVVSLPRVDASFEQTVGRRDVLATRGSAAAADSTPRACNPATGGPPLDRTDPNPPTCAPRAQWGTLSETWEHRLSRRISLELTGGAAVARNEIDTSQPYNLLAYPVAGVLVGYALRNPDPDRPAMHPIITDPPKPSAYAYARVGPVIDNYWGFVDPRLEIGAAALDPINDKYTLLGHAAFVRSLPPTALDASYFAGDVELLRRIDKYRFEFGGGLRGAYQKDPFTGEFYVISAYLTFIWHEPRIKF
ncbi:MAG TPA: hypothetical protein VGH28_01715 [Polyangiaceae bacterium]|jgi:hypothetical protein